MLRYSLTKTKQLVLSGQIRSIKDGGNRRILPEYVDEYVRRREQEAGADGLFLALRFSVLSRLCGVSVQSGQLAAR